MKLIIGQIAIFFVLICVSECGKYSINRIYNEIYELKRSSELLNKHADLFSQIDKDCVKKFLKISQNGKLKVTEVEQVILSKTAVAKCVKDEDKFFKFLINTEFAGKDFPEFGCFKFNLQKLEPTSPLVQNYTSNYNETEVEKCQELIPNFSTAGELFAAEFGTIEQFTCGAVTDVKEFVIYIFKLFILESGDLDENIKEMETNKMIEILRSIFYRVADCIHERIENNREVYSQNITLKKSYDSSHYGDNAEDQWYQNVQTGPKAFYEAVVRYGEAINGECVKKRLNLQKYGDKELTEVEERIIFASAEIKCTKIDLNELAKLIVDLAAKSPFFKKDYVKDSAFELKKLEPNYMLLNENNTAGDLKQFDIIRTYFDFDDLAGTLDEITCGAFEGNDVKMFGWKFDLIAFEENEELKSAALKQFVDEVVPKLHKTAECIIGKLN